MHQDNGDQAFIKYRGNIIEGDETGSLFINGIIHLIEIKKIGGG